MDNVALGYQTMRKSDVVTINYFIAFNRILNLVVLKPDLYENRSAEDPALHHRGSFFTIVQ